MSWSIIIFCYNEGGNLADTTKRCLEFLAQHIKPYEIIIVNDGSRDNTKEVSDKLAFENACVKVVHHERNLGIGSALRSGYRIAQFDFVCAVPGDGQFDPSELKQVPLFGNGVFYSFYRRKNEYNIYRKSLTHFNRLFNRIMLGIKLKDVNWIKIYRKEQLDFADMRLTSSIVESEICAKLMKSGCRPIEIPSTYQRREAGKPKGGSWKTLHAAAAETWLLFNTVRNFKSKKLPAESISDKTGA